jgi:hypothetical protein
VAADRLYPAPESLELEEELPEEVDDIEAMIAQEVSDMKTAKRRGVHRFLAKQTNLECLIFISCNRPYDPLKLVELIASDLLEGKPPKSR